MAGLLYSSMLTLTEAAIKAIKALSVSQAPTKDKVRITATGNHDYSVIFESESSYNDEVLTVDGVTVLIDSLSMLFLEGAEMDYLNSPEGGRFTFRGPNLARGSSPGASGSIESAPKRAYVQSMPCRIDRAQERQYGTELSTLHPGDIVGFRYDDASYEAVIQKVNSTNATVTIVTIEGTPRRAIAVGLSPAVKK
jgi:iron-sulfur cluster assembly accessory protein